MYDFEPGEHIINPANKDWGIGKFKIIGKKVTVNFEKLGKPVINI